jgi:DNA-binding Lrp family transcriptional regulator
MNDDQNNLDADLLLALQQGIPLEKRPFALIGQELGLTEAQVFERTAEYLNDGRARRFGAVFDSRSLGYDSTLCAVDVPEDELERTAGLVTPHPGVTHCYQRQGTPNLWFTMTAPADALDRELEKMAPALAPHELLNLTALRTFKIEAVFDVRGARAQCREANESKPGSARHNGDHHPRPFPAGAEPPAPLSEAERVLVRALQGDVPLSRDPFQVLASELGYDHAELLEILGRWKAAGILRRVGLVMRHRKLGFTANSMCVWKAADDRIEEAGRIMAAHAEVTHCYERPVFESFPFNLYAMIHADNPDKAVEIFERLSSETGLTDGRMLVSLREFKKSSPVFFCEDEN